MKKLFTLLLTLSFPMLLLAQLSPPKAAVYDKDCPVRVNPVNNLKADGDVFWSTTFDFEDPSATLGWSWPAGWTNRDEFDRGDVWVWGNDSIKGRYTRLPGLASHTPDDGWIMFTADLYNYKDNVSTSNAHDAWVQLPDIDCSSKSSVVVKFYQNFRTCCGSVNVTMHVSNDNGVHWAIYDCKYGTQTNDFCLRNEAEINITDVAAGLPAVQIRFRFQENSHYFWAIDDLSLSEGYHNELVLEDDRAMMNNTIENDTEGFMPYLPWKQFQTAGFGAHTFWGALFNNGLDDQEAVGLKVNVFKNGENIFNATSPAVDIWTLERDTIDFTENPFRPDAIGDYYFEYEAISDNDEQVPVNNTAKYYLTVCDSIYSRCDDYKEDNQSTAGWVGGNNDGDYLGVQYTLVQPMEVNSLSVLITHRADNPGAGTRVGFECQYWLFKYITDEGYVPIISSIPLTIEEQHLEEWVTLVMEKDGESEFLEPGDYIAAIQTWHGGGAEADNGVYRFSIGYDMTYYTAAKSVMFWPTSTDWGGTGKLNMIRMNFNETSGITTGTVIFNVDMNTQIAKGSMNPATDFVDLAGAFNNWNGSAHHLTDADGDGIYTITVPDLPLFQEIDYKYRINGSETLAEFPTGSPREAMVRYYTILDDTYNNGISVLSVPSTRLNTQIGVYPNPSSGTVNVSIRNAQPADTDILITSLQGQVIYSKHLTAAFEEELPLDLSHVAKGLYLLKVNETITKLIIE